MRDSHVMFYYFHAYTVKNLVWEQRNMREFLFSLKGIAIEGVLIVVLLCMVYFDVPSMIQGAAVSTNADAGQETDNAKDYIKWVEFHVTSEVLQKAYEYEVDS